MYTQDVQETFFVGTRTLQWHVRVFANSLGDRDSIPGRVIPKTQKMVHDAPLHYKVRIKGKVEQPREWSSALLYTSV